MSTSDPSLNPSLPPTTAPSGPLGPGGTQGAQPVVGPGGTHTGDSSLVMISAIMALITSLGTLNSFLKTVSSTLLSADLSLDQKYADQLSRIKLSTPLAGTKHTNTNREISAANQQKMMYQQVLQARLKTHQNQEQIDIQSASTTTSNMRQLASIVSSMIDLIGQIFGSVNTINRG